MTTLVLVGLIVALLAAAAYVGVLLVRRSRSAPGEPDAARPRTVADLVKRRVEQADDPEAEMSGDELFVPAVPRQDGVAVPAAPDGPAAAPPSPQPVTPAGGLEVGDAPWRRAARMTGAEPGGAWETAPFPVVAALAPSGAHRVESTGGAAERPAGAPVPAAPAGPAAEAPAVPAEAPAGSAAEAPVSESASEEEPAEPASPSDVTASDTAAESPWTDPDLVTTADDPALVTTADGPAPSRRPDGEPADRAEAVVESAPEPVSRPLSDPDLTPLMGIPIIRTATVDTVVPGTVAVEAMPDAAPDLPAADGPGVGPTEDAVPAPVPRTVGTSEPDDDVVFLLSPTSSFPVVAPAATGSPQPVWFRVVRRDGEPVPAGVVALLDDRGREVDTTKTAADGGGELRTPHGGRFLLIVSADGYQPRAAMITVDEKPVELALLLPRSAKVSGSVRAGAETVRDAHVIVRQDHDVVDETLTVGDGHYRFDDLAEGTYTIAATAGPGGAVARVSLAEGADTHVDLDLR